MLNKLSFVAGVHGNESLPLFALTSRGYKVIAGNPKALRRGVRFIDCDLNASFGLKGSLYEVQRANQLLELIPEKSLVVDFHTTTAITKPFAIVVDKKMVPFAATTGLKYIVIMKYNIKNAHALINYRKGISIEVGNHSTQQSFDTTLAVVDSIEKAKRNQRVKIYEVYDIIKDKGSYSNFQETPTGFIPILAGEKSYPFFGLKAKEISC